ncbi:MAG TPA: hypothetical protein VGH98_06300 [Gemmatimonadaceae bacterium]|jgi:hypothetical protein
MLRVLIGGCFFLASCTDLSGFLEPAPPALLNTPLTVTVGGKQVAFDVGLTAHPGLDLSALLRTTDNSIWPSAVSSGRVWVLHRNVAWVTNTTPDTRALPLAIGLKIVLATGGPSWPAGDSADVVMELRDGSGATQLVRAPRQVITR